MSITSETQRKYDPNKGGFSYYTLFHADKGERPSWAQDGDMLEEFGEGGKAYVCSRDAKGRIKWTEKADWDRQTGGGSSEGGGGLPADFPAEDIANANKIIGFDASGDYDALDPKSEVFWIHGTFNLATMQVTNIDKTYSEIKAAMLAEKDVMIRFSVTNLEGDTQYVYGRAASMIEEDDAHLMLDVTSWVNLGNGFSLLFFHLEIAYNDATTLTVRKVITTELS